MALSSIQIALFTQLETIGGLPAIFYPNVDDTAPTTDYISPFVLPANTNSIGIRTTDQEIGVLQVSIYIEKGKGQIEASRVAGLILANFPRNLNLTDVRIDLPGSIGPVFYEGKYQVTPVSIPYQHIS